MERAHHMYKDRFLKSPLSVVILAAGKGVRMQSGRPKVLQPLGGSSLLSHVLRTARALDPDRLCVVTGYESDQVRGSLSSNTDIRWILQSEPKGTGHAMKAALDAFPDLAEHRILVLYGDVPLIRTETLQHLIDVTDPETFGLITACFENPVGLGRIVRNPAGQIQRIVEEKDASDAQKKIQEINTGIFLIPGSFLKTALPHLSPQNAKQEYYLTDLVEMASQAGVSLQEQTLPEVTEVLGANDRFELSRLERVYQERERARLIEQGVLFQDPSRVYIRGDVTAERDVMIDVDVILEGIVRLASGVRVGPFVHLKNVVLQAGVQVLSHTVLEDTQVAPDATLGPFARLRGGVKIGANVRVGNFVEIKNSTIGEGSKMAHLGYVGDATFGAGITWGAGAITCNFDGKKKHVTSVGDGCFVGSNSVLVAPLSLASQSFVAAGSVITRDVPTHALAVARAPQKHIEHWVIRHFSKAGVT